MIWLGLMQRVNLRAKSADSLIKSMPGGYISMIESVMNATGNTSLPHNPIVHSK